MFYLGWMPLQIGQLFRKMVASGRSKTALRLAQKQLTTGQSSNWDPPRPEPLSSITQRTFCQTKCTRTSMLSGAAPCSQNSSCDTQPNGWQTALLCMNTPVNFHGNYPGEHFAWRHSKRVTIKLKRGGLRDLVCYWFVPQLRPYCHLWVVLASSTEFATASVAI